MRAMQVTVVIPAFNEAATLRGVVERTLAHCTQVIVVDDASTDATVATVADLPVTVLRQERNAGKAAALRRGFAAALERGAQAVVTLDADGQHRPEDIPRFVAAAQMTPEALISGSRLADRAVIPTKRYIGNRFANFWIAWAAGLPLEDSQCGMRLYPAALLRAVLPRMGEANGFVFESEVLVEAGRAGFDVVPVSIPAIYDPAIRPSNYKAWRDTWRITRMVAGKLVQRGLYLPGLLRSIAPLARLRRRMEVFGRHGVASFVVANTLIVATAGLSYLWVLARVWRTARDTPSAGADARYILVPGHRLTDHGPSLDHIARLERALQLHRQYPRARLVLLGRGVRDAQGSEAQAGADWLRARGVADVDIVTEQQSRNTWENLLSARRLIEAQGNGDVVLVSNRYHLERARVLAALAQLPVVCRAAEERLPVNVVEIGKFLREAYIVHWVGIGNTLFPSVIRGQATAR